MFLGFVATLVSKMCWLAKETHVFITVTIRRTFSIYAGVFAGLFCPASKRWSDHTSPRAYCYRRLGVVYTPYIPSIYFNKETH
ncbi:hypothetical protein F4806DRAFT_447591 [Annulohypoxylon nitens]|nr:hypothetical protein F4806DRAFT_447591 [Annulohypoxylon nitens]